MPLLEPTLPLLLTIGAWIALGVGFAVRARPAGGRAARRDLGWRAGIALQGVAVAAVFSLQRGVEANPPAWDAALRWSGVALAWASVWLAVAAVRTLGRQWSLEARVVEGHRLVREGPYALVRHPIYTAILGLLVATGLNLARWPALAVAIAVYLFGTRLRTRAEDGLLRREFGEEYQRYARRVPALLPWPFGRRRGEDR